MGRYSLALHYFVSIFCHILTMRFAKCWSRMAKDFMLLSIEYISCFTVKDSIQHTHSGANVYMRMRVVYMRVCTWLHVWTYWYAHICVCIGVCVLPIFIWHFNPSSIFLYIIYIAHCAIILLCTLMLYICDRSTPDFNKDDELKIITATRRCRNISNQQQHSFQWNPHSHRLKTSRQRRITAIKVPVRKSGA